MSLYIFFKTVLIKSLLIQCREKPFFLVVTLLKLRVTLKQMLLCSCGKYIYRWCNGSMYELSWFFKEIETVLGLISSFLGEFPYSVLAIHCIFNGDVLFNLGSFLFLQLMIHYSYDKLFTLFSFIMVMQMWFSCWTSFVCETVALLSW